MRRKKWIAGILLGTVLLCLTGCEKEEPPAEQDTVPVDKKVDALVINTEDENQDSQKNDEPEAPETEEVTEQKTDTSGESGTEQKESENSASSAVLEDLQNQLKTAISAEQAKGTSVSVYAENLSSGGYASVGSSSQQSASLIKLFIAGCIYEHPDIPKTQETYENETEELIHRMITISDNDATNTLVTRLGSGDSAAGMALVNEYCSKHNFPDTHMGRLMLDFNAADDNYTSVNDCGHFLSAIHGNELAGSENILSHMKQQERTGKIPAGVPAEIETANKTGELDDVENDAAIIWGNQGAYTLCVILNQLPDTGTGRALITELSTMVYNYMETP